MAKDRLTKLLERSARLDAQIKDAKARQNVQKRKKETRRKIMAGADSLAIADKDAEFRETLAERMNRTVTRPEDRAMFDFLDGMTPLERPAPAASDGFAEAAAPPGPDKKRKMESS
jgi:hypothetical protein